jgi:hypothetical protein
LKVLTHR